MMMEKWRAAHRFMRQASKSLLHRRLASINSVSCFSSGIIDHHDPDPIPFSMLVDDDVINLKNILGEKSVVQDEDRLESANSDWMHKYKGSRILLLPNSTEEVSQILKYCNSRRLAVVPQGGNTGLVAGSVPVFDGVIVQFW